MKKFSNMGMLLQFLLNQQYPDELTKNMILAMHPVEECNANGDNSSCIIIAESEAELQEAESEYNLKDCYPETDESITAGGQCWRKRVFVFGDYGNGIVLYSRSPSDNEKRTE